MNIDQVNYNASAIGYAISPTQSVEQSIYQENRFKMLIISLNQQQKQHKP